jgi:hypothetical protein
MPKASITVRSVRVIPPEGVAKPFLYVDLKIDCDVCGITEGVVFGHHLRTLYKALGMIIEANGDLCGDIGEITSTQEYEAGPEPTPTLRKEQIN